MRSRLRFLLLALICALAPLFAAFLAPVRGADAYVGQIWDSRQIFYGQPGQGADAEMIVYSARSAHLRFWFRNPVNSGDWHATDAPIFTCLGSVNCWQYQQVPGYGNWRPDHVDLVSNDYYNGYGGYIYDAGPL